MPQKPRQEEILRILQKQGYVTVKELVGLLHYSSATINRDLNAMEMAGLVKRSYGGVEAVKRKKLPPLPFRYSYNKKEKRHIGHAAAAFIKNGDTVFIDASTTTSYLVTGLAEKKDLHVITNNMQLAIRLSEIGIRVTVTGGTVAERPSMLAGEEALETVLRYRADKMFFSTGAFTASGYISGGGIYHALHRAMMRGAKEIFFLADAEKLTEEIPKNVCTFADVDVVISDFSFPDSTKETYPETKFINVEK